MLARLARLACAFIVVFIVFDLCVVVVVCRSAVVVGDFDWQHWRSTGSEWSRSLAGLSQVVLPSSGVIQILAVEVREQITLLSFHVEEVFFNPLFFSLPPQLSAPVGRWPSTWWTRLCHSHATLWKQGGWSLELTSSLHIREKKSLHKSWNAGKKIPRQLCAKKYKVFFMASLHMATIQSVSEFSWICQPLCKHHK